MKIKLPELVNSKWCIENRKERSIHHSPASPAKRGEPFTIHRKTRGFTLIELLVVIGILTVLLAIVLIAINPSRQFAQANNTQRRSDVNAILNAIHQYAADHKGDVAAIGVDATERTVCTPVATCASPSPAINLCGSVATPILVPTYLADMPRDPKDGTTGATGSQTCNDLTPGTTDYNTKYTVVKNAGGRITVKATAEAEGATTPVIQVTR